MVLHLENVEQVHLTRNVYSAIKQAIWVKMTNDFSGWGVGGMLKLQGKIVAIFKYLD